MNIKTTLFPILIVALALHVPSPAQAAASTADDREGPLARVEAIVDAWNRGDRAATAAWFERSPLIIDDTPPYLFSGPGAIEAWEKAYAAGLKAERRGDAFTLRLASAETVEVEADRAYVAVRAEWVGADKAVHTTSSGTITVVLDRVEREWRVAAWIWTPRRGT